MKHALPLLLLLLAPLAAAYYNGSTGPLAPPESFARVHVDEPFAARTNPSTATEARPLRSRSMTGPRQNLVLFLLIAFIVGILSCASPCIAPVLPAYFVTLSRCALKRKNAAVMTLAFFAGMALTFSLLGMSATLIGTFLRNNLALFGRIAGVTVVLFGLLMIAGRGFGLRALRTPRKTYTGCFVFGMSYGLAWTPCIGPVLGSILALAATSDGASSGGLLLFAYAAGMGVPLLGLSLFASRLRPESRLWRALHGKTWVLPFGVHVNSINLAAGLVLVILGSLMFSGTLYTLNQSVQSTVVQQWMFGLEESLTKVLTRW